jgi:hypothetical protein
MNFTHGYQMLEMFLPLPIEQERIVKRRRGKSVVNAMLAINYSGKFVSVKDYQYKFVARKVGEQQVGVNLFYLVDSSTIVGYRNSVGYYLRQGAKKRNGSKEQTRKAAQPKRRKR